LCLVVYNGDRSALFSYISLECKYDLRWLRSSKYSWPSLRCDNGIIWVRFKFLYDEASLTQDVCRAFGVTWLQVPLYFTEHSARDRWQLKIFVGVLSLIFLRIFDGVGKVTIFLYALASKYLVSTKLTVSVSLTQRTSSSVVFRCTIIMLQTSEFLIHSFLWIGAYIISHFLYLTDSIHRGAYLPRS
jgi:hypothetical protein